MPLMAGVLVLCRLCDPSSELSIAEHGYAASALPDLLGIPPDNVNDDRLYRTLDVLVPHKQALEKHLKTKLGELFDLKYDLLLYDVTSTYFEGEAAANPLAQRGYSRDSRPDCKQVCIGLVVSRCGMPLGYEVFAGNRHDSTTVEHIVKTIESRYGQADRIWAMDRGMVSEDNVHFLRQSSRRYILGTSKSLLKKYEQDMVAATDWQRIRDGLEVTLSRHRLQRDLHPLPQQRARRKRKSHPRPLRKTHRRAACQNAANVPHSQTNSRRRRTPHRQTA